MGVSDISFMLYAAIYPCSPEYNLDTECQSLSFITLAKLDFLILRVSFLEQLSAT